MNKRLLLIPVGVVAVYLAVWFGFGGGIGADGSKTPSAPASTATPTAVESAAAKAKPAPTKSIKALKERVKDFTEAFYSYDSSLTATSQRQAVRSLATNRFMRNTFFGLVDSPASEEIKRGRVEVQASVKSIMPSEQYGRPPTVDLPVVVTMTQTDENGATISHYDQLVRMTWIKRPAKGWLIDSLTQ